MESGELVCLDFTYEETIKLIRAYKRQDALWNPHLGRFHNKETKNEAWKLVAAECGIEPDRCKRKIKSLVNSCRREKTKIINSRRSGKIEDVVEPKWRYWNAFKFLRGLEDDEEDPLGTAPEMDILDPTLDPQKVIAKLKRLKNDESSSSSSSVDNNTADETIGSTVARKLRKMYPDQRMYAESVINQILDMAALEQLLPNSKISTPDFQCGQLKLPVIHQSSSLNSTDVNSENFMLAPVIQKDSPDSSDFECTEEFKTNISIL